MKTLFFLFTIVASLSLNAQITKNNWLVGGELNFIQTLNPQDVMVFSRRKHCA